MAVVVGVLLAFLLGFCWKTPCTEGVEFSLNGDMTDGPVNVNDIGIINTNSLNTDVSLICQSEMAAAIEGREWFLHPDSQSTDVNDEIDANNDRGWSRRRATLEGDIQQVFLWRSSASGTPLEGIFTCRIPEDTNPIRSLYVLHPISSVTASIVVVSGREREFRVQCTSTGGRALSMTVTGPGGYNSDLTNNIQPVGTPARTGSDQYSATTSDITGGSNGDMYTCNVEGSTSDTDSVQLRVASAPIIEPLTQTAVGTVRVVWSQPTGVQRVTGYIIHYTDSSGSAEMIDHGISPTNYEITGLTGGETYTISVEATSLHLSGESGTMSITLEPPPDPPGGVMAVPGPTSVTVSWEAVDNADNYTVTFTRVTGAAQKGLCSESSHSASVSVIAPATTASIDIGLNVESTVAGMLRAYSTYFITVVAVNASGSSAASDQISVLTPQIGAGIPPRMIVITVVTSTEMSVQWSPPISPCRAINGNITGYIIQYRAQPNGVAVTTDEINGLDYTLTGLTPFTNYSIEVAAVNEEGDVGVYSEPQYVKTEEAEPGPVGNLTPFPSFFMITITWEEPEMPNGIITHYEIVYGPTSTPEFSRTNMTTVTTFTTLSDLEKGTEYTFNVTAYTRVGPGDPITVNVLTLNIPPAVENVSLESLNDTSVSISWDPLIIPGHPIDSYTVVYSPVQGQEDEEEMVFAGTVTSAVITGLDSSVNYQFQVFATVIVNGLTLEGNRSNPEATMRAIDRGGGGGGGSSPAGGIAAGVIVSLVVLAVIVTAIVVFVWMRHRRREKESLYKPSPKSSTYTAPPVHYSKTTNIDSNGENAIEPQITKFPEDKHVLEGQKVVFKVKVTGSPQPKLTWYHDGEEVVADYSKELGDDGSLTMPSAETKHSGVYQLVARNKAGSMEREVKLFVKREGEPSPYVARKHITFSPIPVEGFGEYVARCHANDNREFRDQYTELDKDADHPKTIGTHIDFKLLNRFANITVYDNNRIILRSIEGHSDCQRDFINACYVDGYKIRNKFIATQGPLPKTVVDFWRLVWQEKPLTIVMVTNLKEGNKIKCQQYWPETGTKNFGPFQVTISDEQTLADYTTRTLIVELKGSSERGLKVTQFHFTAWPDHGVPDYATPILAFHRKIKKQHRPSKGPMLVHCSAGVGRTGTLITIDRVLDQIQKERVVDIAGVIQHLRQQRMKMVQNVEQYIFINDAILEAVTCGDTQITASDLRRTIQILSKRDPQTRLTGFENQFKVLDQVSPKPDEIQRDKALENPSKNRSEDFLPGDRWRVVLKGEVEDYIHAVVVNGYKQQRAFIIAQSPMQSTARDFWKMVYDRKCGVIVMLCELVENGKEVCYQYWPNSGSTTVGEFTIEHIGEEKLEGFIILTFSVLHRKTNKAQQVCQIRITNWRPDGHCSNLTSITDVISEVTKIQQRTGNKPILVHCSDTVSRSGMFCAITTTIERCKAEQVVDVFQVVKALRVQKPGAVRTVVQYHTLFETVLVYLDSFDTYGNFQDL